MKKVNLMIISTEPYGPKETTLNLDDYLIFDDRLFFRANLPGRVYFSMDNRFRGFLYPDEQELKGLKDLIGKDKYNCKRVKPFLEWKEYHEFSCEKAYYREDGD